MTRIYLDSMLDRYAAASSAALFVLCAAFAFVIWWRIFFVRPPMLAKETPAPAPPVMSDDDIKALILACAIVVSAVALRYLQVAGGRLGHWRWGSFEYDATAALADTLIIVAVLYSIWRATHGVCGFFGTGVFGGLAFGAGAAVYFWG